MKFILFKAIENTRLLKTYTDIDPRVSQLGYMIKHLAKVNFFYDKKKRSFLYRLVM
jgi:DNA polymerase sigma